MDIQRTRIIAVHLNNVSCCRLGGAEMMDDEADVQGERENSSGSDFTFLFYNHEVGANS